MSNELTPTQLAAAEKIQKILNLAAKAGTPEEAATATAMAQKLLAQHNLDAATVESNVGTEGKREEAMVDGGFYEWQRSLWRAVAGLNFCMYWNQKFRTKETTMQNNYERDYETGERKYAGKKYVSVMRRRHALIGRMVNVRATQAMAGYLEQAIKRVTRDRLSDNQENMRSNWAKSFQAGAADEIVYRLKERRNEAIHAEQAAKRRTERDAKTKGHSTSTALSLTTYAQSEADANYDHVHGEGSAAEIRAERAERARIDSAMEAAYTLWAKANPRKAQSDFEYHDKQTGSSYSYSRRTYSAGRGYENKNMDYSAYSAGSKAAKAIGLDQQAGGGSDHRRLK